MDKDKMTNCSQILLVDDESGIRRVLEINVRDIGYDVLLAPDGESALEIFNRHLPAIVITDIKMPGIDGIEVLRTVKKINPSTEVIMITGHGDLDLAVKSLQYEATDFITKPVDTDELEKALERACDRISFNERIKSYLKDLETLVQEKDKELDKSARLVTISHTIAGMSHAIKNIAGSLKGSSFVIEQGIEQGDRDYLKQGWEMVKGNIEKITNLSMDLLNYARISKLNLSPHDPCKPLQEAAQLMQHRAKKQEIDFTVEFPDNPDPVIMDAEAVHTCLMNLLTNAFDAVEDTEVPASVKKIRLSLVQKEDGTALYMVTDTGCGMNEHTKSSLFNEFISTKGNKGTGFGLMTTKKIVEEHGGFIDFTSEPGQGSTFSLRFPQKGPGTEQKEV